MRFFLGLSAVLVIGAGGSLAAAADDQVAKSASSEGKLLSKPDAFRTLVNPQCSHCVDEAKRRAGDLRDDDRMLAWIRGYSQGGGIPLRFFLVPYRVISDTYGVFVYDAEAGYMRGFEPSLDFEFFGWRNGVMVMQHKDGTRFSCLSGRAFDGPRKGHQLKPVATLETDWGWWLKAYPGAVAYHMFEKYQPIDLPTGDLADSLATRGTADARLPAATPVIGVSLGERTKAYTIEAVEKAGGLIADTIGDEQIVVLWYGATRTAAIYAAQLDEEKEKPSQPVKLKVDSRDSAAPFVDAESGSRFDVVGRAVAGPLRGRTLRWLPGVQCRWFAWAAEYPTTELMKGPNRLGTGTSGSGNLTTEPPVLRIRSSPDSTGSVGPDASQPAKNSSGVSDRVRDGVIVDPSAITPASVASWAKDGFRTIVVALDESQEQGVYARASKNAAAASLDLFYWIEVGRNQTLAKQHPEWMASLGMHEDWRARFPNVMLPKKGEVAKAFPWVPIGYREAYDAHLARVGKLLERAVEPYRGVLLNDLQGGPSSCGCGNLLCRWAIDYHVPATATKLDGNSVAARFVSEVQALVGTKTVVPVWTTECEEIDLPAASRSDGATTGYCGSVPCANGTCPKAFTQQWSSLVAATPGPICVLATHKTLARDLKEYGDSAGWIRHAIDYLDSTPAKHGGSTVPHDRLWLVVQGHDVSDTERTAARRLAAETGAAATLVSLVPIDQSFEPRIVAAK